MLLKFEIISIRIDQVIIDHMIYHFFWNTLYISNDMRFFEILYIIKWN